MPISLRTNSPIGAAVPVGGSTPCAISFSPPTPYHIDSEANATASIDTLQRSRTVWRGPERIHHVGCKTAIPGSEEKGAVGCKPAPALLALVVAR
jgi:hypothetical protein